MAFTVTSEYLLSVSALVLMLGSTPSACQSVAKISALAMDSCVGAKCIGLGTGEDTAQILKIVLRANNLHAAKDIPYSKECGRPYGYLFKSGASMIKKKREHCSCYLFDYRRLTWRAARTACWKTGGDLVSIETEAENKHVKGIIYDTFDYTIVENEYDGFWTSGSDAGIEGRWIWEGTGNHVTNIRSEDDRRPFFRRLIEDCLYIHINSKDLPWDDGRCGSVAFHICEKSTKCITN